MMAALPQHMQALELANEIRFDNAEFRRTVRVMSPRRAAEFVADCVECDYEHEARGTLRMDRMLKTVPYLGANKVTKCLLAAGVLDQSKRLRELTPRQRKAVAAQLRLWAAGYRS